MICFWCDTHPDIGLGHVVRCLAIAQQAAARGEQVEFVVTQMWPGLDAFLNHYPFPTRVSAALPSTAGVLVVDHYGFHGIAAQSGAEFTVLIDDLGERDLRVDLVVNPNVYARTLNYPSAKRQLLGADYALLREEFIEARSHRDSPRQHIERVFVMLGGVDPTSETQRVLEGLALAHFDGVVDMVSARTDLETPNVPFTLQVHRSIRSPAELMQRADIAVCAAGGTTWELAAIGVPAVQVVVAENQLGIGRWIRAHDVAIVLDAPVAPKQIHDAFERLRAPQTRAAFTARALEVIDGLGTARLLNTIREMTTNH